MPYSVAELKHNRILYLYGRKEALEQQLQEQTRTAQDAIASAQQEIDRLSDHIGYNPGRGESPPRKES